VPLLDECLEFLAGRWLPAVQASLGLPQIVPRLTGAPCVPGRAAARLDLSAL